MRGRRPEAAIQALKHAQCIFFDVDSTITNQEGIDELARYLNKYDEVSAITEKYQYDNKSKKYNQ